MGYGLRCGMKTKTIEVTPQELDSICAALAEKHSRVKQLMKQLSEGSPERMNRQEESAYLFTLIGKLLVS